MDDIPVDYATIKFGNDFVPIHGGHFNISEMKESLEVIIEGQCFNISLSKNSEFCLWRFYHCDLIVLDSDGNRLENFTVYLNDMKLGPVSRIVVPLGTSMLRISTQHAIYSLSINVSAPIRMSITLPLSDLNIVLMSKEGFPLKNQESVLRSDNSEEYILSTDEFGFARLSSFPHGIYKISLLGQEKTLIHNSSIKQRLTIDVIGDLSVEVGNSYLLFPTRISVKLTSINGQPSRNSTVILKCDGSEYRSFTDSSGTVVFYIPPSISACSNVSASACGITKSLTIYRNPAPMMILTLFLIIVIFLVSKRMRDRWSARGNEDE